MVIKLENNRFCSNSHFAGCNMSKSQLGHAVIAIQKKKVGSGQYRIREYRCCYHFCCRDAMNCVSTGNAMWDFSTTRDGWRIGKQKKSAGWSEFQRASCTASHFLSRNVQKYGIV